ncbi:MAG: 23S rRNA (guanosine(2251)-2'-O)-methyltransferase RlmB, partial [Treponema sp.]|nr:23S rRNA (guanosine(2251)-2'-O)-methyltransferase RlmB [Treponema sp.]
MIYLTGFHAINERIKFCNSEGKKCGPLLVAKTIPRARGLIDLAIDCKVRIDRVGSFELDKLAPDNRGIALLVDDGCDNNPDISIEKFILDLGNKKNVIVLIMDEITDPHNYGAIIRSCDQFGVDLAL